MGNWIPNDPTLVAQILKISSNYTPPPPEGFVSPMTWGVESNVIERFGGGNSDRKYFVRAGHVHLQFRAHHQRWWMYPEILWPDHEAFEAAEKKGQAAELQKELEDLFNSQNTSQDATSIPATFLRVTVERK